MEEGILFLLSLCVELPMLTIADRVSQSIIKNVSLGLVHETLLHLELDGLICKTVLNTKTTYKVTAAGIETLQTDWSYYSRSLYRS
jgi:DNA-binding PadR family transcriptional regulator